MAAMKRAMAYWGPDGSSEWIEGPIGLGHLMHRTTPESLYEKHPLTSACGNFILIAHARIDNRKELFDQLSIPVQLQKKMPDNELIMKAWEKWGRECPKFLIGDWIFALFDKRRYRLFLARDHFGISGLYYYKTEKQFIFASSLKGLFALSAIHRELNSNSLTHFLTRTPWPIGETLYKDIMQVIPSNRIQVSQSRFQMEQYWTIENTQDTRFSSDDDYIEAFMELYTEAVKARLRSIKPVGTLLSGGLDSGSVSALAARELKQQGKVLHTFSSVPLYDVSHIKFGPNRFLDETPYIKSTVDFCNTIPHLIKARQMSPTKGVQTGFNISLLPMRTPVNQYWIYSLFEKAKKENIGVLLSGQKGNLTVSWKGEPEKHTRIQALIYMLKNGTKIFPTLSLKVQSLYLREINRPRNIWEIWSSLLNPEFLDPMAIKKPANQGAFSLRDRLKITHASLGVSPYETGAWFNLEIRDPTADKRVVEYCYSLPNDQYWRQGTSRFLIRRSMAGLLPDKVRLNPRRGKQAGDLGSRVLNDPDLAPILTTLYKSPWFAKVFNVKQIKELQRNTDRTLLENIALVKIIMTGLFLMNLES